jgi:hypothetical protein
MTWRFWQERFGGRGVLLAELPLADERLRRASGGAIRRGDGIILPNRREREYLSFKGFLEGARLLKDRAEAQYWKDVVRDEDVVLVQTKERVLGPRVIGQTVFGARLLASRSPASIQAVALTSALDDDVGESWLRTLFRFPQLSCEAITDPSRPFKVGVDPPRPHREIEKWYLETRVDEPYANFVDSADAEDRRLFTLADRYKVGRLVVLGSHLAPPALGGRRLLLIHTAKNRMRRATLNLPVLGEAVLHRALVQRHCSPESVRSVIVCDRADGDLRPFLDSFPEIELVERDPPTSDISSLG